MEFACAAHDVRFTILGVVVPRTGSPNNSWVEVFLLWVFVTLVVWTLIDLLT